MWLQILVPYLLMLSISISLSAPGYSSPRDGGVRLVGGAGRSEGRVEVYHNGQWGTVCMDGWDQAEAEVVCRQLGYPGAQSAVMGGVYGRGSGPIWLGDLLCRGTEKSLADCRFTRWGVNDCTHYMDAGVICLTEDAGVKCPSEGAGHKCDKGGSLNDTRAYPLDHASGLPAQLGELFDSGRSCDLTVLVQSPGGVPEEERLCLHSVVLSLLLAPAALAPRPGTPALAIQVRPDCRPYVSKFLRYLYTRQIDVTVASAACVHRLASDLGVRRLQEASGRLFAQLLHQDRSFQAPVSLYAYAIETGDLVLQETCLRYLAWNCHRLLEAPAWGNLSLSTLRALLARSDLVVPDEGSVLRGLESWVRAQRPPPSPADVAGLLEAVRFPMIPAEQLFNLRSTSDLYADHESLFSNGTLEGFQFNALPFPKLKTYMEGRREQHTPRIYTAAPWSRAINFTGSRWQEHRSSFQTPVHSSAILQAEPKVYWSTVICLTRQECLNAGYRVTSAPATWLFTHSDRNRYRYRDSIRYSNKMVVSCEGRYVFQVLDLKETIAPVLNNVNASQGYPCNNDQFFYQFVVLPVYIF